MEASQWRLEVTGLVDDERAWSLAALRALPQEEQITRHICVEGWSQIGQWSGVPSPGTRAEKITKVAAPRATNVLVRRPARRLRHCRSKPMTDGSLFDRNCHAQFPSRTMAFCGGTGGTQGFCRAR